MGLLNFLSKKSESDLTGHDSLKACAYDATVALAPPIRGTYPVRGNGSKILEQYQRSHPNLASVPHHKTPVPSPSVPRLRNDGPSSAGVERPRTAPSSQPGGITTTTISSSTLHPQPMPALPSSRQKKFGPYRLPPKLVTDIQVSSVPAQPARSPGLVSMYSASVRSGESNKAKGYVDLLDAQSMIKPSDFYNRIQATGARNYGEDVADRNREEKNTIPDTPRELQPEPEPEPEPRPNRVDPRWSSVVSKDVDDTEDEPPRRPTIRHSMSTGLRSRRSSSHASSSYPKRISSRLPPRGAEDVPKIMTPAESARSERAARRKSTPSLSAAASNEIPRSSSTVRRVKEDDANVFPDALRDRARATATQEREYTKPNISTKRQSLAPSQAEERLRQKRDELDKPLPALPPAPKDASKRRSGVPHNVVTDSRLLVKRQSLHSIRSGSRGEVYEDTYQQKISLQGPVPRERNPSRRQLGSTTDLQDSFYNSPAQQPDQISQIISSVEAASDRGESRPFHHVRKQSTVSLFSTDTNFYEIENSIPQRTSSLRHWSLTSETAMSTLSSNPFRPQSGHTTSTSVDLSPLFPRGHADQLIPPVPDHPYLKTPAQSLSRQTSDRSYVTARQSQSSEFYLEDYASSDESSMTLSRGSYERDLLFSESGFGIPGNQVSGLPGLFDATVPIASADPPISRAPENDMFSVSALLDIPNFHDMGTGDRHETREAAASTSSDDEMNFDIPKSRTNSAMHHNRMEARVLAGAQPIDETDDSDF